MVTNFLSFFLSIWCLLQCKFSKPLQTFREANRTKSHSDRLCHLSIGWRWFLEVNLFSCCFFFRSFLVLKSEDSFQQFDFRCLLTNEIYTFTWHFRSLFQNWYFAKVKNWNETYQPTPPTLPIAVTAGIN